MTQTQVIFHNTLCDLVKFPRFFSVERIIGAVQTVNRREYSVFYPSCHQFIVTDTHHMATDIMAPPSISNVACCIGKIWLEL